MAELEARSRKHAALADPARLRIVDLLAMGDISPTELQADLGMPSNLVSHHLNTLESAGIVMRHRSEGDKRRSYVTLAPAALTGLSSGSEVSARRVVFVCTANSARSHLASLLWQAVSDIPATSAGTHPAEKIAEGAVRVASLHGLELPDAQPRALEGVIAEGDYVVTVCDSAREELGDSADSHWSLPDPTRVGDDAAFDSAFVEIQRRVLALAPRLTDV